MEKAITNANAAAPHAPENIKLKRMKLWVWFSARLKVMSPIIKIRNPHAERFM